LIDVVTAAIAICILYFLVKVPLTEKRKTENKEKTSHVTDLIDGLKYLKYRKYLLLFVVLSGLSTIFMSPLVLFSLQVTRNFGADLWRLSAVEIGQEAGMIVGGLLIGVWCFRNKIYAVGASSIWYRNTNHIVWLLDKLYAIPCVYDNFRNALALFFHAGHNFNTGTGCARLFGTGFIPLYDAWKPCHAVWHVIFPDASQVHKSGFVFVRKSKSITNIQLLKNPLRHPQVSKLPLRYKFIRPKGSTKDPQRIYKGSGYL
jgi:hypothetical protein